MADSPLSDASHESDDGSTGLAAGKAPAAKDKECPYCHQRFTSSSLGRHLDQYIHKKKPDGIHNIEEIRRQRGGITRRTARHSSSKNDREGSNVTRTSPSESRGTPPATVDRLNGVPLGGLITKLNAHNWHSTGVINDIDMSKMNNSIPRGSTPTGLKRPWSVYDSGQRSQDPPTPKVDTGADKDTVRALELALREVLDSLQAASTRASSGTNSSPFDFDIQSQTFPALCLLLLPSPPTLFSSSPFSTATSFPLEPPGAVHLDCLRLKCQQIIHRWKWDALGAAQRVPSSSVSANLTEEHEILSRTAQQHEELSAKHLGLAFANWNATDERQRQAQWQLELSRAFVKEQNERKKAEERLERVQQEANQLQSQVEMLSKCQWPREMALWPPERVPIGENTVKEMRYEIKKKIDESGGGGEGNVVRWDFERLLGKWKKIIREDKNRTLGVMAVQTASMNATNTESFAPSSWPNPSLPTPQPSTQETHSTSSQGKNMKAKSTMNGNGPGVEHRRRSGRTQLVTSMADQDDVVREFNGSLGIGNGNN